MSKHNRIKLNRVAIEAAKAQMDRYGYYSEVISHHTIGATRREIIGLAYQLHRALGANIYWYNLLNGYWLTTRPDSEVWAGRTAVNMPEYASCFK